MIIVRLAGGLGNQMFQYAFGRTLSIRHNIPLKIDTSFLERRDLYPGFVYRNYELDIFNTIKDFESNYDVEVFEQDLRYNQEMVDNISRLTDSNIKIEGYFQSVKYFEEFESIIKSDFTFKNLIDDADNQIKSMLSDIRESNSVMINIRRTDFLNGDFHCVLGLEYINKAVDIIKSKIDNPRYFIFSDDIEWCQENIKLDNMVIVDHSYKGDRFSYYLQLMKECKNFIIPNSSFAWWAAWLCDNDDKIIIAPEKWLNVDSISTEDLVPKSWIII